MKEDVTIVEQIIGGRRAFGDASVKANSMATSSCRQSVACWHAAFSS
jgi:hypothetical protein